MKQEYNSITKGANLSHDIPIEIRDVVEENLSKQLSCVLEAKEYIDAIVVVTNHDKYKDLAITMNTANEALEGAILRIQKRKLTEGQYVS